MVVTAEGLPVLSIPPLSSPSELPQRTALPVPAADAQPIDFLELSFAQLACPDVQTMLISPSLSVVSRKYGAADVLGDVSTGTFRPLLPARFRSAAVLSLHNIHHPGVKATRRMVCSSFCWPKMGLFVSALTRNCLHCQKGKGTPPCVASGCAHSSSGLPPLPHSHRSCWPTASLFRFLIPVHSCGQDDSLARGNSARFHHRRRLHSGSPPGVDPEIRSARHHH